MSQPVQAGMSALDFQKIKDFLTANLTEFNHEAEVCATLQALSWRINRTKGSIRRYNLQLYSHFDLIDLVKIVLHINFCLHPHRRFYII